MKTQVIDIRSVREEIVSRPTFVLSVQQGAKNSACLSLYFSNLFYPLNLFRTCKRTQTATAKATAQPLHVLLLTGERKKECFASWIHGGLAKGISNGIAETSHCQNSSSKQALEETEEVRKYVASWFRFKIYQVKEERVKSPDVFFNISRILRYLYRKKLFLFLLNVTVFMEMFPHEM